MQFTIPEGTPASDTIGELKYYLESDFENVGHGALGYESMALGIAGAKVLTSQTRPEHHVILPGEWCDAVGPIMCSLVVSWVFKHGGHFTRLDLAGDDYSKAVKVRGVAMSVTKGQLVSHCHDATRNNSLRGKPQDGIYVGSRKSRRMLRIYDKGMESNGVIDAVRWELQLRDEAADRACELVLETNLAEAYLAVLVGLADFRKVSNDNSSRRPRMAWFKKLVGEAQKATLALPKPVKTIEGMEIWLRRQVAPSLAAVVTASGGDLDIVDELVNDGKKRMKAAHRMAIEEALKARSSRS